MVSKKVTIINPSGLHVRPAATLAKTAKAFSAEIFITASDAVKGAKVNVKNVMALLDASIPQGMEVKIECDGKDEEEALAAVVSAIESGLGE